MTREIKEWRHRLSLSLNVLEATLRRESFTNSWSLHFTLKQEPLWNLKGHFKCTECIFNPSSCCSSQQKITNNKSIIRFLFYFNPHAVAQWDDTLLWGNVLMATRVCQPLQNNNSKMHNVIALQYHSTLFHMIPAIKFICSSKQIKVWSCPAFSFEYQQHLLNMHWP